MEIEPVTADRWGDLVALFGDNGGYANCWCTWWRISAAAFDAGIRDRGAGNRELMRSLVGAGAVPGLLAYDAGVPVGWCSVARREEFERLERSPVLKRVDEQPGVWSIVCFYIDRGHRGQGVATALLDAAVAHAAAHGATVVEGYAVDDGARPADAYTGVRSMFEAAGFEHVVRRRPTGRSIMRRWV